MYNNTKALANPTYELQATKMDPSLGFRYFAVYLCSRSDALISEARTKRPPSPTRTNLDCVGGHSCIYHIQAFQSSKIYK
jgi:hypothetical protein